MLEKIGENRWFLLLVIALTWGSPFILIKKSLIVFSPFEIDAIRVGASRVIMAFWGVPALKKMPKNTLLWMTLAGFFGNILPMFLFSLAQTQVSSSLAGILDSLVPVFVLVLGYFLFGIRSKLTQAVGAFVGFGGTATLMYFSELSTEGSQLGYAMLVVLATACYAVSALLIKHKLQNVPSMQLSGAIFTIWMIPSFIILIATGFFTNFQATPQTWEAAGYLGILTIVGTTVAMIL
jgi:drug/metabolite transporter (DMT)-like permease